MYLIVTEVVSHLTVQHCALCPKGCSEQVQTADLPP
jgi:hypothetical protein